MNVQYNILSNAEQMTGFIMQKKTTLASNWKNLKSSVVNVE